MKPNELKKWPKLWEAFMSNVENDFNNEDFYGISYAFVWRESREGEDFWHYLQESEDEDCPLFMKAKALHPELFEVSDTYKTIVKILEEQLGSCYTEGISILSTRDSLGMDSLDDVEVIMVTEEEFMISDIEAESVITVGDLVELVDKKLAERGDPPKLVEGLPSLDTQTLNTKFTLQEYEVEKFKRETREALNKLVAEGMVDGDYVEQFDKLLKGV